VQQDHEAVAFLVKVMREIVSNGVPEFVDNAVLKQIHPILLGETVDQRLHNCLIIIQVANFHRRIFGDARERNINNFVSLTLANFAQNFAHHPAQKKNNFTHQTHKHAEAPVRRSTSTLKHQHSEKQAFGKTSIRKNNHAEAQARRRTSIRKNKHSEKQARRSTIIRKNKHAEAPARRSTSIRKNKHSEARAIGSMDFLT
jgi:hypothetical protein